MNRRLRHPRIAVRVTRSPNSLAVFMFGAGLFTILLALLVLGCGEDKTTTPAASGTEYGCSAGESNLFKQWNIYWGDLHSHTVFSDDAAEADPPPGPPSEALAWATDPAGGDLDFVAITDHAEYLSNEEWTAEVQQFRAFSRPGCVVFLGFEYTNSTWTTGHGHKCVIMEDLEHVPEKPLGFLSYDTPIELWTELNASPAAGHFITIPHHPAKGLEYGFNMSTDWDPRYVSAAVQPLVEIYSVHGNSEARGCEEPVDQFQEDSSLDTALELWRTTGNAGYKLGILGSTDNHNSQPGAVAECEENLAPWEGPYTGGLCAAIAPALTREEIWGALTGKRTYATSGARIVLEFTATTGADLVPMGGTLITSMPANVYLHVRAVGDGGTAIREIRIIRNGAVIATGAGSHLDFKDAGVAGNSWYRVKVLQEATPVVSPRGTPYERAWSSPVWVQKG